MADTPLKTKAETRGRKRLLEPEAVLAMAVSMGIDDLRMSDLARALGVGTATLYQYFPNRKALVRAAAVFAMEDIARPEDTGQSWQDLSRDYLHMLAELLSQSPDYLTGPSHSEYGYETHFKLFEPFAESLKARGFAPSAASEVFHCISMIAFGAAVESLRAREFEARGDSVEAAMRRQYDKTSDYPLTGEALDVFVREPLAKADRVLARALAGFAPGETS